MAILLAAEAERLGALLFGQFEHEDAVAEHFGAPGALPEGTSTGLGARRWRVSTGLMPGFATIGCWNTPGIVSRAICEGYEYAW